MKVSNPDRVVFPDDGITKGEVVGYYRAVADRMLPYVAGRALSVERFPKGIGEAGFMQKNVPDSAPDVVGRHEVAKDGEGTTTYPVVDSAEGLLYFANLGAVVFHVPTTRVADEAHPDWVIWDLDPPPDGLDQVRAAAARLREVLDAFAIPVEPLTSGSRGYHLRVRIEPTITVDDAGKLSRGLAEIAAAAHPDLMTTQIRKRERHDRVFVDWLRNGLRQTAAAPWSLRARSGAPVATPITWEDVATVAPDAVRLPDAVDRADAWTDLPPVDLAPARALVADALDELGLA